MGSPRTLALSLILIACSVCCVITSILLLIGLSVDSPMLLIPWLISVFLTTSADVIAALCLLFREFNNFLIILFIIDLLICFLNVYSIVCVFSQYQEYNNGMGNQTHRTGQENSSFIEDLCKSTLLEQDAIREKHLHSPKNEYKEDRHHLSATRKPSNEIQPSNSSTSLHSSIPHLNGVNEYSKELLQHSKSLQNSEETSSNDESPNTFQLIVHSPENDRKFESKITVSLSKENKRFLW